MTLIADFSQNGCSYLLLTVQEEILINQKRQTAIHQSSFWYRISCNCILPFHYTKLWILSLQEFIKYMIQIKDTILRKSKYQQNVLKFKKTSPFSQNFVFERKSSPIAHCFSFKKISQQKDIKIKDIIHF